MRVGSRNSLDCQAYVICRDAAVLETRRDLSRYGRLSNHRRTADDDYFWQRHIFGTLKVFGQLGPLLV